MSVSFSAYIVFGVRIKYEKLFQSGEQRGCDHETRDFQFCPECGEQMWKSTTNKVELNPFENSLSNVSYYFSFEPSKRDNIVIGFFVNNTDDISSFNELTDAQKRHYTDKLKHWLKTNNIDCNDEPKMYLISNVD